MPIRYSKISQIRLCLRSAHQTRHVLYVRKGGGSGQEEEGGKSVFEEIVDGGDHAHFLDVRRVLVAVLNTEITLLGTLDFAEPAVGDGGKIGGLSLKGPKLFGRPGRLHPCQICEKALGRAARYGNIYKSAHSIRNPLALRRAEDKLTVRRLFWASVAFSPNQGFVSSRNGEQNKVSIKKAE